MELDLDAAEALLVAELDRRARLDAWAETQRLFAAGERLESFRVFCEGNIVITTKVPGETLPFRWTEIQRCFNACRFGVDIVLKARQIGLTTNELARDLWFALTRPSAAVAVVVQPHKEAEPKKKLCAQLAYMIEHLGVDVGAHWSGGRVTFGNESVITVLDSGGTEKTADKQGRGGTFDRVHLTESAFYPFADASRHERIRSPRRATSKGAGKAMKVSRCLATSPCSDVSSRGTARANRHVRAAAMIVIGGGAAANRYHDDCPSAVEREHHALAPPLEWRPATPSPPHPPPFPPPPPDANSHERSAFRAMARVAQSVVAMSAKKTAWHPPFTGLLRERCPRWAKITGEVQLTTEPLRVDDVIEVWADDAHDPSDTGATLREMWRYVVVVALLEYKSIAWPFRHGDLGRLLACGLLRRTTHQRRVSQRDRTRTERLAAHEVTLVLAVPSRNAALDDELADLELTLHESTSGYHLVKGFPLPLLVIDLGVVAEREDDDLLGWFAGRAPQTVDARRWVRQHLAEKGADMTMNATPDLEGYEEFVARLLTAEQRAKTLTPEERVAGLTPEQRLAGLAPEQRLAGLAPEELANALTPEMALLALPDIALRALSEDYLATLSADVQAKVRARRGD